MLALAVLMAGVVVLALSSIADAKKKPSAVSVKGKGVKSDSYLFKFKAQAKDGDPLTKDVSGRASIRFGKDFFNIKVQRLNVSGDSAFFLGKVTKSKGFGGVQNGDMIEFEMTDSGLPDEEGDKERDSFAQIEECREPNVLGDEFLIEEGNVTGEDVVAP